MGFDQNKNDIIKETEAVKPVNHKYNYADYLSWADGKSYELIDGIIYNMTPAPSRIHQKILGKIHNLLYNYLEDKKCEIYSAPFDVRLPEGQE